MVKSVLWIYNYTTLPHDQYNQSPGPCSCITSLSHLQFNLDFCPSLSFSLSSGVSNDLGFFLFIDFTVPHPVILYYTDKRDHPVFFFWLISLNMISSSYNHVVADCKISSFLTNSLSCSYPPPLSLPLFSLSLFNEMNLFSKVTYKSCAASRILQYQ